MLIKTTNIVVDSCKSQGVKSCSNTVPAISPKPAIWAIARSIKIIPLRNTSRPSGPFVREIINPIASAGVTISMVVLSMVNLFF